MEGRMAAHFLTFSLISELAVSQMQLPRGYTCRDGSVTASIFDRCNGILDCLDGSDEIFCESCANGFPCEFDVVCTSLIGDRCDGEINCNDGSDERNCFAALSTSNPFMSTDSLPTIDLVVVDAESSSSTVVGLVIGLTIAGVLLFIVIPIAILVVILCYVKWRARSASGQHKASATDMAPTAPSVATPTTVEGYQDPPPPYNTNFVHQVEPPTYRPSPHQQEHLLQQQLPCTLQETPLQENPPQEKQGYPPQECVTQDRPPSPSAPYPQPEYEHPQKEEPMYPPQPTAPPQQQY